MRLDLRYRNRPEGFRELWSFLVTPPERVVFTRGLVNEDVGVPPGSTIVEVTLTPVGSGTHVRLVHRDLPASARGDHEGGWTDMLERLARVASTIRTEQR